MSKLKEFLTRNANDFFDIKTKNGMRLCEHVEISTFFEDFVPLVQTESKTFDEFFSEVTDDFQEMKEDNLWYYFKDWNEESKRRFKLLCLEFYNAAISTEGEK